LEENKRLLGVFERQLREETILNAAAEVFCSRGFGDTRMLHIAKKAKLSKGLLYFYYKSKDDLYMAVILNAIKRTVELHKHVLENNAEKPGLDRLLELLDAYFVFSKEFPYFQDAISTFINMSNPLKHEKGTASLSKGMKESPYFSQVVSLKTEPLSLITDALAQGKIDGSIKTELSPMYLYLSIWSLLIGYEKLSVAESRETDISKSVFYIFDDKQWQATIHQLVKTILTTPGNT
jgi:AcrR family transcriptional regulator